MRHGLDTGLEDLFATFALRTLARFGDSMQRCRDGERTAIPPPR